MVMSLRVRDPCGPSEGNHESKATEWAVRPCGEDANIFVASGRAGKRVMARLQRFLEKRLRLFINPEKSAVRRPQEVHFLGFRFCRNQDHSSLAQKRWRESKPGCRR